MDVCPAAIGAGLGFSTGLWGASALSRRVFKGSATFNPLCRVVHSFAEWFTSSREQLCIVTCHWLQALILDLSDQLAHGSAPLYTM